jgi:hypothetical protein
LLALLDADIFAYRVGFTTEDSDERIAAWRIDEMVQRCLDTVNATAYELWLSDSAENNFRFRLSHQYKATRTAPKPRHLEFLKEHLVLKWNARFAHGEEADDKLGIRQVERFIQTAGGNSVICSIDKDLKQIPGQHFNFVKEQFDTIQPEQGECFFYQQILIGDVADNIKGCTGIGEAKAAKLVKEDTKNKVTPVLKAYREAVKKTHPDVTACELLDIILLNGQLLKIRTYENEIWAFPKSDLMEACESLSIQLTPEESIRYTEPTTLVHKTDGCA